MRALFLAFPLTILAAAAIARQAPQPDQSTRPEGVVRRGEHVMGLSHQATTHHFRLFQNGGEIVVTANNSTDKASLGQIRSHLAHIAKMFSVGNFNAPMLIHDTNPPGVATMTRLKEQIRYEFSEIDRGARIRLITASPETTDAVHAFLLFQIVDHQTGDARFSFRSRSRTRASTDIRQSKTDPDVTSMKLSIPKPTREILPAISPATTAVNPSAVFQAIVKYSSRRP
jgi:hypothetical protein